MSRIAGGLARPAVTAGLGAAVIGANVAAGYLAVHFATPLVHNRDLLWIAGRTLGMAALAALALLVVVGLWIRHPWRARWRAAHAETLLLVHAALGAAVVVLVVGHVAALALDTYAGVGWRGAVVPGAAAYRPVPVALGVVAAYFVLAVAGTVTIGGRIVGRRWRLVHHLSLPTFALVWCHGVLAGSDTSRLRIVYGVVGTLVCVLAVTRVLGAGTRPVVPGGLGRSDSASRRGGRSADPGTSDGFDASHVGDGPHDADARRGGVHA